MKFRSLRADEIECRIGTVKKAEEGKREAPGERKGKTGLRRGTAAC